MNFKVKTKGISLIVLVITIIVIVILAGAVILSLSQNNPLNSANESVFKNDLKAFESDLSMYLTEKYVSTVGSYNPENLKADDLTVEYNGVIIPGVTIKNIIPVLSTTNKYDGQLEIVNGRLVYKGTDIPKKRWAEEVNLEVVNGDRLTAIISTAIGLPIAAGTNAVCTIKISSNSSIDNIGLTGNLELLDVNSVPVIPQPVFTIAAPTGNDTDTLRNVDVTINTTTLVEGSYKLKLKARCISNIYGITNESDVETGILFEIDNTPPINPTMAASPAGFTNGNVTVTISYAADAITKQYSTNGTTWLTYTTPLVVSTNNSTVYAKAIDISGNQSGQTTITIANIDKISPTVVFGTNGGVNLQTASTTVTVSDLGPSNINASTLQYVWDTQNSVTPVSGWAVFTNTSILTKASITGTYYLWIKGSDNAGNTVITKSNSFIADNTAPVNPTMVASPTGWTTGNVTVTVTYPGDATIKEYSTNGTTWMAYTAGIVVTVKNTTVYARATDASGNQSGQCTLTVANIDKVAPTAPTVNLNGYTSGTWTKNDVRIDLSSTDADSGIQKYQYSYDGSNWNDIANSYIINYNYYYYITYRSIDNVGNISASAITNIIQVDKTAPVNPIMAASPTGWTNGNVTVTVTYPGDATIKEYSTNGTTWIPYTTGVIATVNNTTVYARATDAAGNQSGQSTLTVANIDRTAPTAPTVNLNGYTSGTWTKNDVRIDLSSTDANSGIQKYQYSHDGSNWNDISNSYTINSNVYYYITYRSIDNAGNISSSAITNIIQIDKSAPTYSSYNITNVTADTYDVYVYGVADGGSGVNKVQFPTWTSFNGQDDLISDWTTNAIVTGQNLGGGTWKYTAKRSEHNGEYGEYLTNIYFFDNLGNSTGIAITAVTLADATIAAKFTLSAAQEIFNGSTSYSTGGEVSNNYTIEFDAQPSDTIDVLSENTHTLTYIKHRFIIYEAHGAGVPNAGLGVSLGTNGLTIIAHSSSYYHVLLAYYTNLNAWNHYKIVVENKVPRLYVNGTLVKNGYPPLSSYTKIYSVFSVGNGFYYNFIGRANNFVFYNVVK